MSVKVVEASTVEFVTKKNGKTIGTETDTVSADGKAVTQKFTDYSAPNGKVVSGESTETRVTGGPAGSHAISGSWRTSKVSGLSDDALTVSYESTADSLRARYGTGESFDAKFDGKYYPIEGDAGHTLVALKRIGPRTIEQDEKRDGKVIRVLLLAVAADGKSMSVKATDNRQGTTMTYTMMKR